MWLSRFTTKLFGQYLPSPFAIAVILTGISLILALLFGEFKPGSSPLVQVFSLWETGLWNQGLLVFAYQMMLILVLGHVLVLSEPADRFMEALTRQVKDPTTAVLWVLVPTLLLSFFNWGLGLIFGALVARKVGEFARRNRIPVNYPLLGACGYAGMMIWHGGISGSAPIKASEPGHLQDLMRGSETAIVWPDSISTAATVFSWPNLLITFTVILVLVGVAYRIAQKASPKSQAWPDSISEFHEEEPESGEQMDNSVWGGRILGGLILIVVVIQYGAALGKLQITPNLLNLFMLGLGLALHGSFKRFLWAVGQAISGASGILIQFPLYFGIMGLMVGSGLIEQLSEAIVQTASAFSLPIWTFFSAGLVNVFVPSGGGQWAVQGPLVLQAANELQVPYAKVILALSYGDQLTNMLQPFWALPLLGITGLRGKDILPYSLTFMFCGGIIYLLGLMLF
ncbi:short-chain fatty acid transporter [Aureicoccus marinus]|uniref:Short-chain fatty acid transporter n=1 Tax=Aureicoccus marinus TaxID=754435 RepID=A0A2S7T927_9FLAO|nr:TIGR00366 family protein [Aureicoccus marinus]PQJ16429.1 short-chain fatty acid transporter [Aureicoccus marinus]